jgi:acyl-CoA synthetase (NDP forming)
MKVMSADVVHKFDASGVLLNIEGADGAKANHETFDRKHILRSSVFIGYVCA